jgi:predicted transposase/invertase (TIGR01784 family)
METIHNPHDKLFHEIYSRKEEAQSFLEHYLPNEVLQHIEFDSLEICKDSFVDEDLKEFFSDILYTVNLQGQPGYIYVLFEHKSYEDRLIHLQLLEYMVKIWRLHLKQQASKKPKQKKSAQLPIILPLVIYHGEKAWPYGIRFCDLLTGPREALAAYIPDFAFMLTDLTGYSDEEIKGSVLCRVVLLLFKHIFDPDPGQKLLEIFTLIRELIIQESGLRYLELILRYVCSATDKITAEELLAIVQQTLDRQGGEMVMTIAEQLRQEGMEKGLQRGRQEGKFIGEILLTQRMLALTIYDEEELERKSLDELRSILASMKAKFSEITKD